MYGSSIARGSGSYAGVIAGIEHVVARAASRGNPSVANMSLGGGFSSSVNDAVNSAVADGVTFAVSSGNSNADACGYSPASAASAITVNSSTSSDARSSFSNYGSCTDIFAPGSGITSTVMGSGTGTWSGTSMASPHVAGVAALFLEELGDVGPAAVWTAMESRATRDKISGAGSGSPNLLLYSGTESGDPCAAGGCGKALVESVSEVTMKTNRNRRASGTVTVTVTDAGGAALGGVVVRGDWTVTGASNTTSTETTGADGTVTMSSGNIRNATGFAFCVTSLSKSGYEDGSAGECDGDGGDPGSGDPDDPLGTLEASSAQRGRNFRVNLTWTGGGGTVEVWRGPTAGTLTKQATVTNSGSYTDNVGKSPTWPYYYEVCTASSSDCSAAGPVTAP